jgi:hypothetical protein
LFGEGGETVQEELIRKLRYKSGRAIVLKAPEGYTLGIEEGNRPEGVYDFVQLFVHHAQDLNEWLPKTIPLLKDDAVFWITYPKQSSKVKTDINRDSL